MRLADLLLLNGTGDAATAYPGWLREQVATNAPFDEITRTPLALSPDGTTLASGDWASNVRLNRTRAQLGSRN